MLNFKIALQYSSIAMILQIVLGDLTSTFPAPSWVIHEDRSPSLSMVLITPPKNHIQGLQDVITALFDYVLLFWHLSLLEYHIEEIFIQ